MIEAEIFGRIAASESLQELQLDGVLPEPYDDSGYYLVYYAEADYKHALPEIISYMESGLRIYYDRYLERGASHLQDFLAKGFSSHCRCIVFYLSEAAFADPTFCELARTAAEHHLPVISVNRSRAGAERSGVAMAREAGVPAELLAHIGQLFPDEVTYIPFSLPLEEKKRELLRAYESNAMRYSVCDGFAVAEYVKDLSEVEITVSREVEIAGVKYPVRAVAARAFADCRDLKSVVIPDTVEEIGFGCEDASNAAVFENCEQLEEVVFPPRVKKIYGGLFRGCHSLRRIVFNEDAVFAGNSGSHFNFQTLRNADLSDVAKGEEEEEGTIKPEGHPLEEICLPRACRILFHLEEDGDVRFCYDTDDGCAATYLISKTVRGGTENVLEKDFTVKNVSDYYLFSGHSEVERVVFPSAYNYAPKWIRTFYRCSGLREVVLPDSVVELERTFEGCENLERIRLPESMVTLGSMCFADCTSLREITLPRYLYHVADLAFHHDHLDVVVSDSIYSRNIFKSGYREEADFLEMGGRGLQAVYRFAVKVMMHMIDKNTSKQRPFTWWCEAKLLYITDQVKPFPIDGYEEEPSDRAGYRKYRRHISEIDHLMFLRQYAKP